MEITIDPGICAGEIQSGRRAGCQGHGQRLARLETVFLQLAQEETVSEKFKSFYRRQSFW